VPEACSESAKIRGLEQQLAELKDVKQKVAAMSSALEKLQPKDAAVAQR
jgi:hypothetical protein